MIKPRGLRFGPLTPRGQHLCIDMQNLFAEPTPWHTPWMARVLPAVEAVVSRFPERTVFTRFVPPAHPQNMRGAWQRYYAPETLRRRAAGLPSTVRNPYAARLFRSMGPRRILAAGSATGAKGPDFSPAVAEGTAEKTRRWRKADSNSWSPTLRRAALSRRATGIASRSAGESGTTSEGDQKLEIGFVPAARRLECGP